MLPGTWWRASAVQTVCDAFEHAGFQIFFVGGCVRNAVLGAQVTDIDMTTDATPDEMITLAERSGLRAIPTGIDHGTLTFVERNVPIEITTFRADVETDGRHAVVRFSRSIEEDAARRDFTMNALYADRHGALTDPLVGLPDLRARRVRFIGDAEARVAEDHLRSLRYFRFFATYGDQTQGFDLDALAAIAGAVDGLALLSKERVTQELLKVLAVPDPVQAMAGLRQTGALQVLLPGADERAFGPFVHLENTESRGADTPDLAARLAALGGFDVDCLRLPKALKRRLEMYRTEIGSMMGLGEIAYRHDARAAHAIAHLRAAMLEQPVDPNAASQISVGAEAVFPISAADLRPAYEGPALGARLKALEHRWIASGFTVSREALLE